MYNLRNCTRKLVNTEQKLSLGASSLCYNLFTGTYGDKFVYGELLCTQMDNE
jgi:hypothetical protein